MLQRLFGIDEAGYGPNLGPLVMASVEATLDEPELETQGFDLWSRLPHSVCRARGPAASLWVDDSKRVYKPGGGLGRLDDALGSLLLTLGTPAPLTLDDAFVALGVPEHHAELEPWSECRSATWPALAGGNVSPRREHLRGEGWRIASVRAVVVGPERFNAGLALHGSKAGVHFDAFAALLGACWEAAGDGLPTSIRGDKHGGRHYYAGPIARTLPAAKITTEVESPALSRYRLTGQGRRITVGFEPKADAGDGLVALASLVAKGVREHWMAIFNAFWARRIPGLRPTAGYPLDAARYRAEIEAAALAEGFVPSLWWRDR